jgi:ABC-2 type transport system permease protein
MITTPSRAGALWLLTARLLRNQLRTPFGGFGINLMIAGFFFLVYLGSLGGTPRMAELGGGNYASFLLPAVVVFTACSGAATGMLLVEDMRSGYLRRLLLTPVSRVSLVLAPMIVGAIQVVLQTLVILAIGLAWGARVNTGLPGVLLLLLMAFLWGVGLAGVSVAVGLGTGNAEITQSMSLLLFPLIFLSSVFVPRPELQGWLRSVAGVNPATYVIEGMRAVMLDGWQWTTIGVGIAVSGTFFLFSAVIAGMVAHRVSG